MHEIEDELEYDEWSDGKVVEQYINKFLSLWYLYFLKLA